MKNLVRSCIEQAGAESSAVHWHAGGTLLNVGYHGDHSFLGFCG